MAEDGSHDKALAALAQQLRERFQDIMDEPIPPEIEQLLKQLEETVRSTDHKS